MIKYLIVLIFSFWQFLSFGSNSCESDFKKYCSTTNSSDKDCIDSNLSKFSAQCIVELKKVETQNKDFIDSCMKDIEKNCPLDVEKLEKEGTGYVATYKICVNKMKSKFSDSCKKIIEKSSSKGDAARLLR